MKKQFLPARVDATEDEVRLSVAPNPADLDQAFLEIKKAGSDALYVLADPFRPIVAELALSAHLPSIFQYSLFVDIGGLMSYGANYEAQYRRAASFVNKILKGAKAGDLPVEQATEFELVINMKTAKALGRSIAPSVLVQANKA